MKQLPIIETKELLELNKTKEFVLIDASAGSKNRFDEKHLSGALFIDLNEDLADIQDFAIGGRHPLPSPTKFADVLTKLGIANDTHVVIYDDKNGGNAAARFWWMLRAVGHQNVQVLNGGFQTAIDAGYPADAISSKATAKKPYEVKEWNLPTTTIEEVESASKTGTETIIDVRDANRFAGLTEPIDLIAGHIPGAINIPFTENLDDKGRFLTAEKLKEKYKNIEATRTIVHCGSGVTACHTLLAMDYAGLSIPKLYVGSWSEWSRNNKDMVLAQ